MLTNVLTFIVYALYPAIVIGMVAALLFFLGLGFLVGSWGRPSPGFVRARRIISILLVAYLATVIGVRVPRADIPNTQPIILGSWTRTEGFPLRVFTHDSGNTDPNVRQGAILLNFLLFAIAIGGLEHLVFSKRRRIKNA